MRPGRYLPPWPHLALATAANWLAVGRLWRVGEAGGRWQSSRGRLQRLGKSAGAAPAARGPTRRPPCLRAQAARRRAITELLFFASVGDSRRCQRIVRLWNLQASAGAQARARARRRGGGAAGQPPTCSLPQCFQMLQCIAERPAAAGSSRIRVPSLCPRPLPQISDPSCCDYDKRTPL